MVLMPIAILISGKRIIILIDAQQEEYTLGNNDQILSLQFSILSS